MVIQPTRGGDQRERVMFEVGKADVALMLDKLKVIDAIVGGAAEWGIFVVWRSLLNISFKINWTIRNLLI